MANEEQVNILKQGVDVWNKWRADNPSLIIDLRDANLRGFDLSHADFFNANLSGTKLNRANLRQAVRPEK